MYTADLVKTAASWPTRPPSGVTRTPNVFAPSRDWERVAPPPLKLTPRYADDFKKRMDNSPNLHPHTGVASSNASIASFTTVSTLGVSPTDYFGLGKPAVAGEERFRSLTELKWGEFEALGFGGLNPAEKKYNLISQKVPGRYVSISTLSCCVTNVHLPCCSRERRNERRTLGQISRPLDSLAPTRHSARHYNSAHPS